MRLISLLLLCGFACAQTAKYPAEVVTDAHLTVARNGVRTTLAAPMSAGATSFTVRSATNIVPNLLLTIGTSEIVKVCSVAGTTVTVGYSACPNVDGRGFDGTTAAIHTSGEAVAAYPTAWHHNVIAAEIKAMQATAQASGTPLSASFYDFAAQSPAESLIAGGVGQAITLTPCPLGVAGADTAHYLRLTGANAETVLITGGTCTSGAATGTVTFTPANNHTAGAYTVTSATAGVQEAINVLPATGGTVKVSGQVTITGMITVNKQGVRLVGDAFGWANAIDYAPFLPRVNTQIEVADGANLAAAIKVLRGSFNYEDIELNGNKANQTGGTGHGIWITADIDRQNFAKLRFGSVINTRGDGVRISAEAGFYQDVGTMSSFSVRDTGGSNILIDSTPDWTLLDVNAGGTGAGFNSLSLSNAARIKVIGGIFDSAATDGGAQYGAGVHVWNSNRITLSGVSSEINQKEGFVIAGTSNHVWLMSCEANDNSSTSAGTYAGIRVDETANHVYVGGGTRSRNYATSNQGYGLVVGASVWALSIADADFTGNATAPLFGSLPAGTYVGEGVRGIAPTSGELLASTFNWSRTPGGSLTAGAPATVTLTPVPLGVNGADTNHYVYISGGTGAAEAVLITGGTALSGTKSGTITFTPANNHTGAWTIASATGGLREAILAAATGGVISIPAGTTTISAANVVVDKRLTIKGAGARYTTLQATGGSGVIFTLGADRSELRDITIDANSTGRDAVDLGACAYCTVENVRVLNARDGIQITLGSGFSRVENAEVWDSSRYHVSINHDSSGEIKLNNLYVNNAAATATTSAVQIDRAAGVDLGAVYITGMRAFKGSGSLTNGIVHNNTGGGTGGFIFITDSMLEALPYPVKLTNTQYGWVSNSWLNSTGGNPCVTLDGTLRVNVLNNLFVGGGVGIAFANSADYTHVAGNNFGDLATALDMPAANPPTNLTLGTNNLGTAIISDDVTTLSTSLVPAWMGPPVFSTNPSGSQNQSINIYDMANSTVRYMRNNNGTLEFPNAAFTGVSQSLKDDGSITVKAIPFASLGAPSNGTIAYCSDCTVTGAGDNTCAGAGTGALAVRLNGAWRCLNNQN